MLTLNTQIARSNYNTSINKNSSAKESKAQLMHQENSVENTGLPAYAPSYYIAFSGLFNRKPHLNEKKAADFIQAKVPEAGKMFDNAETRHVLKQLCTDPEKLYSKTGDFYYMLDDTSNLFTQKPTEDKMLHSLVIDYMSTIYGPKGKVISILDATSDYFKGFSEENAETTEGSRAKKISDLLDDKVKSLKSWDPPELLENDKKLNEEGEGTTTESASSDKTILDRLKEAAKNSKCPKTLDGVDWD